MKMDRNGTIEAVCGDVRILSPRVNSAHVWVNGQEIKRLRRVALILEMDREPLLEITTIPDFHQRKSDAPSPDNPKA